jgi:hypothetical protein
MIMSIQLLVNTIKSNGFQVYGPEKLTSYVYFTDGCRIGYAQHTDIDGVKFCTVHKANKYSGTGFVVSSMNESLQDIPEEWATRNRKVRDSVVKYCNFEEFQKQYWQPLVKY